MLHQDRKQTELASIIVPFYNAEDFLNECLESVANQTYQNIQLILVDDGSTDNSVLLCKGFIKKYPWMELHSYENKGVSCARNRGLLFSKGKYVFFLDADDQLLPDFVEHFMYQPDWDFIGGGYIDSTGWKNKFEKRFVSIEEYKNGYEKSLQIVPSVHVTGNRYKRRIVEENQLRFNENSRIGEDIRFNTAFFSYAKELYVTDYLGYIYTVRKGSAVDSFWPHRLNEEREECIERERLFYRSERFGAIKYLHWFTALEHYYSFLRNKQFHMEAKRQLKAAIRDEYFRSTIPYMLNEGTKDMVIAGICLKIGSYKLYKAIMRIVVLAVKIKRKMIE